MNGYEFQCSIRNVVEQIPIAVFTAFTWKIHAFRIIRRLFVGKPLDLFAVAPDIVIKNVCVLKRTAH